MTASADNGEGVLLHDADGEGAISVVRKDIFTKRDANATPDIEVLR
ncbi:MAG: hypothetical protein LCH46_07700 [Proteobacteria bacterium]|nr:hypothetical protein [Pseudomonadota bacterium]